MSQTQKWIKKGVVFVPQGDHEWMHSHASLPLVDMVSDKMWRIYYASRDKKNRSHPSYIEVEAGNPARILYTHNEPILSLGELGTFDDSGIMPSWVVNHGEKKYLYYIGWNPQVTVSYRLSIGLAVSLDNGKTFSKYSIGPLCDRSLNEPFFNTAPCVIVQNGKWKMWYVSCTKWERIHGHPEPFYHIKYAESDDGIHWVKNGIVCIDYDDFTEGLGRPCVFLENNIYKMFYSYRSATDYRTNRDASYRIGYAESLDGVNWIRKDHEAGIDKSGSGWDSQMIEYCHVFIHRDKKYMFYNGNGFGRTGFGYAVSS